MPGAVPLPVKVADNCADVCASVTVTLPARVPATLGVNVILTLHVLKGAMVAQLLAAPKSPLGEMLVPVAANSFGLLIISVCAGLVVPRGTLPNARPAILKTRLEATETTLCV